MKRNLYNIVPGDRVVINGKIHILKAMTASKNGHPDEIDEFVFEDPRIGRLTPYSAKKFLALYNDSKIRLLSPTEKLEHRAPSRESFRAEDAKGNDRAKKAVAKAHRRLEYAKAYDASPVSLSAAGLKPFITAVAAQIEDDSPPSPTTLRRWLTHRGGPGVRRLGEMIGQHHTGTCGSRLQPRVQAILAEEAEAFYDSIRVTYFDVWVKVTYRVNIENLHLASGKELLVRPGRSTVWRWIDANLDFSRAERRWGRQEAVRRFGVIKGSMMAEALLDVVVMDHTILDCWVIDDRTNQPIGRPRLTLLIDSCSRMILGFQVGWENAGLDAALAALRHAVRPKDYVREQYPDIPYDWPAYGQPRTLVVDQGLEFMGTTFEDVCLSLGISVEPAPVRTPEYKGQIERLNETFNTGLVHKLPGSAPMKPHLLKEFGVDPQKTAVLFLSDVIELIHRWIITIYSREVHSSIGKAPAKAWMDQAKTDIIELCPNLEDLNRACGRTKIASLSREGIKLFGNLVYRSPDLATIREAAAQISPARAKARQGATKVKITYDAEDISKIYVWNPKTGMPLEVPCVMSDYTRGLSVYLHNRIRGFQRAENDDFQSEAQMCANRVALFELMDKICEGRVVDRKRVQRLRHPERQAQRDLVKIEQLQPSGEVVAATIVEVAVDTLGKRDFTAPKEKRPLLKPKSGSQRKVTSRTSILPATPAVQVAAPAAPRAGGFDYAKAVAMERKSQAGGQP